MEADMKRMALAFLLLWVLTPPLATAETAAHFHNVTYHRCYHAHSCFVSIPGLPSIFGDVLLIRLAGIDTPEILGKCDQEKQLAKKARDYVNTVLFNAREIDLYDLERGEHFNLVARVVANGKNLSEQLIKRKFAVPHKEGNQKPDWCKK